VTAIFVNSPDACTAMRRVGGGHFRGPLGGSLSMHSMMGISMSVFAKLAEAMSSFPVGYEGRPKALRANEPIVRRWCCCC